MDGLAIPMFSVHQAVSINLVLITVAQKRLKLNVLKLKPLPYKAVNSSV